MANIKIKLSGTIENIVYSNPQNDYTVLDIATEDGELITCVGAIPLASEGEKIVLIGSYTFHKEFGKQFAFESYEKTLPEDVEGIIKYLSSRAVKGVGPVTALKIVNRYGTDTFDVIENHPEWLAQISGITMKKAAEISKSFREQTGMRELVLLTQNHLGTDEVTRVYKKLGRDAVNSIRDNPYILAESEYGISFPHVDGIARELNFSMEHPARLLSGVEYILSNVGIQSGHTCLPLEELIGEAVNLLSLERELIEASIGKFLIDEELSYYKSDDVTYVMTNNTANMEKYISRRIANMNKSVATFDVSDMRALIHKCESTLGIDYGKKQLEAIYEALSGTPTIITGGPGTGKTTVIKALLSIFKSIRLKTVLCAPTGRAAKRMSLATSEEAKTVHRLLEAERSGQRDMRFNRNGKNPLDEDVIILDEASMLDLPLLYALLLAMKRTARLILIGDKDQLPSVGAGNIFADLIGSGKINTVRLTEIFRQSGESMIVTNAHRINNGENAICNLKGKDFFFVRENEENIPSSVANLIIKRLPATYGNAIKSQIQVIAPSKKGFGGIEVLNNELQAALNPQSKFKLEKATHGIILREGDRVMQNVNNYDIDWKKGDEDGLGVFNGDIGVVESIDMRKQELKVRYDDKLARYEFENLDELDLAYAITVHKSQGSEYGVVIIPMYHCAPMLMTRNLLYTAVTRAKNMVILVGRPDVSEYMVKNNREIHRFTTLKQRLIEYFAI